VERNSTKPMQSDSSGNASRPAVYSDTLIGADGASDSYHWPQESVPPRRGQTSILVGLQPPRGRRCRTEVGIKVRGASLTG
jgi:hypothetical protein